MADIFLKALSRVINAFGKPVYTLAGKFGYTNGDTVTQATDKTTGVTLNAVTGRIILASSALAAWTTSSFVWTNSFAGSYDTVQWNQDSGTRGAYQLAFDGLLGSFIAYVRNTSSMSLSEAVAFRFTILKGSQS